MITVTKEEIEYVTGFINKINEANLADIQLPNNFKFPQQLLDDWKYTGLSNWSLIRDFERYNDYTCSNPIQR